MGQQFSPPVDRRHRLSLLFLLVLTALALQDQHLTFVSAQVLPPLPAQDIRTRAQPRFPLRDDGLLVQDPSALYHDGMSFHDPSHESEEEQGQEQRHQLEDLCRSLLESPERADPLSEPRLIGVSNAPENATWRLWYRKPAESVEQEGLLIGNGRSQVLVGGAINAETLILSEESCWTGGPGSTNKSTSETFEEGFEYRGGNVAESKAQQQKEALEEFKATLREKRVIKPSTPIVETLQGDERGFGRPEAFGEIQIEEVRPFKKVENYRRELDLTLGVARVTFTAGGIEYTR